MSIYDLTRGLFDLTARRTQPAPPPQPPAAPVFTKQPGADSNVTGHAGSEPDTTYTPYQTGAPASISTATATVEQGATLAWQWQKQNGSAWSDVAGQTAAALTLSNPASGDDGVYRAVATATKNGLSVSANSEPVQFRERFLFLQNDTANTGPLAVNKTANNAYTMTAPAGTALQAIGAFIRLVSNPGNNNGGMGSPRVDSAVSDSASVVVDSTASRQTKIRFISAGTAKVTIKVSNLVSVLTVTVT